jgi:hypothetical protein
VLLDVIKAIRRRARVVSREYDVPYIAGYSAQLTRRRHWVERMSPRARVQSLKAHRREQIRRKRMPMR